MCPDFLLTIDYMFSLIFYLFCSFLRMINNIWTYLLYFNADFPPSTILFYILTVTNALVRTPVDPVAQSDADKAWK